MAIWTILAAGNYTILSTTLDMGLLQVSFVVLKFAQSLKKHFFTFKGHTLWNDLGVEAWR